MSLCKTCGTKLSMIECPDGRAGCMVAHFGCLECSKLPCEGCEGKRDPEADFCPACLRSGIAWAVRQSKKETKTS